MPYTYGVGREVGGLCLGKKSSDSLLVLKKHASDVGKAGLGGRDGHRPCPALSLVPSALVRSQCSS